VFPGLRGAEGATPCPYIFCNINVASYLILVDHLFKFLHAVLKFDGIKPLSFGLDMRNCHQLEIIKSSVRTKLAHRRAIEVITRTIIGVHFKAITCGEWSKQ